MTDNEKALAAKEWITKLAKGINPLDGNPIPEEDIVNNIHISRCLFYAADLIDKYNSRKPKEYELEFNFTPENIAMVNIADKICITAFVKEINRVIPENMKPLSYRTVQEWMICNGYLKEVTTENDGKRKFPTETGETIGITTEIRDSPSGQYVVTVYSPDAQRFILENIDKISCK